MSLTFSHFKFRIVRRRVVRQRRKALGVSTEEYVHARLVYWNAFYNFSYNKVFIRNVRSRWGSCSSRGNLNFNSRITRLPPELIDYVIVHELCHLGEFNHSQAFWDLVAKTMPEYKAMRQCLKKYRV